MNIFFFTQEFPAQFRHIATVLQETQRTKLFLLQQTNNLNCPEYIKLFISLKEKWQKIVTDI
jgi:hypothetical protein